MPLRSNVTCLPGVRVGVSPVFSCDMAYELRARADRRVYRRACDLRKSGQSANLAKGSLRVASMASQTPSRWGMRQRGLANLVRPPWAR